MSNLVDDARRAPTPNRLESRTPLISMIKDAQTVLLRAAMHRRIGDGADGPPLLARDVRRYALWLDQILLADSYSDSALLELAATLYEFAADLTDEPPSSIFEPPLNDLVRSALLASLTPFQGRASIVAGRVADSLAHLAPSSAVGRCHIEASLVVTSLLARRFHESISKGLRLQQFARSGAEELISQDATPEQFYALDMAVDLGRAAGNAASGMLTGVVEVLQKAIEQVAAMHEAAAERDDHRHFWLADRLNRVLSRMYETSMHRLLGMPHSPVPMRYRHILARDGFLELWGPQLEALDRGILDTSNRRNFVISIPTGSGKTLLAELAIMSALVEPNGWALYITPSRSLVSQVSQELRRRLQPCGIDVKTILAGAEQSLLLGEELDLLMQKKAVVVTTPEKLDTYLRNATEIFDLCRLLVVDEAHKLGEPQRGTLLESLITQLLVVQPRCRILLMSGVMSNAEELTAWLGDDQSEAIIARRRSTRQVFGVAVRQDEPVHYGKPTTRKIPNTNMVKEVRRVDFKGGIVLVHEDEDLSDEIRVHLPDLFGGHVWQRKRYGSWTDDRQERGSPVTEHAVAIAETVAVAPGTVLIFMNDTRWAESSARKFDYIDRRYAQERAELAEFLKLELGDDHELPELCRRGVAFHHARLPGSVQRALELALERGWLKVVFATSSLREGINTPATTVIIAGLTYRDATGAFPISAADFANMAGRAGRPRNDTEGRVFLIPNSLAVASAIEAGREYILSGEAALRVKSQLGQLKKSLEESKGEFLNLSVSHQRLLVGLKAAALDDRESLGFFLDRTLWAFQEPDEQATVATLELASASFSSAEERFGERFKLAARVGLSLSSSESLRGAVLLAPEVFERDDSISSERRFEQVSLLLATSLDLEETRGEILGASKGLHATLDPLLAWISGADYRTVLAAGRSTGLFKNTSRVGEAVKFCSDVSNWLSWTFGAAWSIIDSEMEDPDPYVGILPLLVRYGVPSATSAYLSLLGVADRSAAQILATRFEQTGQSVSLQAAANWMDSVDLDDMFPRDRHHLRAELLRRQSFRAKRAGMPYEFATFRSAREVPYGTDLTVIHSGNRVFIEHKGQSVGEIVAEDRAGLSQLMSETSVRPLAVVVQAAPPGEFGAILAIRE